MRCGMRSCGADWTEHNVYSETEIRAHALFGKRYSLASALVEGATPDCAHTHEKLCEEHDNFLTIKIFVVSDAIEPMLSTEIHHIVEILRQRPFDKDWLNGAQVQWARSAKSQHSSQGPAYFRSCGIRIFTT